MSEMIEFSKQVPVVAEADVVVAGSGISGSIAALATALAAARVGNTWAGCQVAHDTVCRWLET